MPTILRCAPSYGHMYEQRPAKTILTEETADPVYQKLKPFLAFQEDYLCPAAGWEGNNSKHRDLFEPNGFHYRVRFIPKLEKGWRRLQFDEFLAWYGIGSFAGRYRKQ